MADTKLPDDWMDVADDLDLRPRQTGAPEGAASGNWHEALARFGERGFLRLLAATEPDWRIELQFALPELESPAAVLEAIAREVGAILEVDVAAPSGQAPWTLSARRSEPLSKSALRELSLRFMTLGDYVDRPNEGPEWLWERLEEDTSRPEGSPSGRRPPKDGTAEGDQGTGDTEDDRSGAASSGLFEAIGDGGSSGASGGSGDSTREVTVDTYELQWEDEAFVVSLTLDATLPPDTLEQLARALAHALRARFDVNARPIPHEDVEDASSTDTTAAGSPIGVHVGAASIDVDGSTDLKAVAEEVDAYLERLQRFGRLGMSLTEVLGMDGGERDSAVSGAKRGSRRGARGGDTGSGGDESRSRQSRRDRSAKRRSEGRTEDERSDGARGGDRSERPPPAGRRTDAGASRRERSKRSERSEENRRRRDRRSSGGDPRDSTAPADENSGGVVLGTAPESGSPQSGGEPSESLPESPLTPGNYTDPRLSREDAETRLVDVVLRHPGYAEEKMAHNLSILLSVDYPDALDLVESAPCILAWGVGRERAQNFKRVIEKAGGKVVLVEPDSLE